MWKSPEVNQKCQRTIHSCIYEDEHKVRFSFRTHQGTSFEGTYVENSKPNCINPYFPSIHIRTNVSHNKWIHIVYTDSKSSEEQVFIDAEIPLNKSSTYPFYTSGPSFYDAPLWTYSPVNKPISFWKGQVFAVDVDPEAKVIRCLGGMEWGFELSFFRLRPIAIKPRVVDAVAWGQAWELIKVKLPGYQLKR